MNPDDTASIGAFRQEVRDFLASALPADLRDKVMNHRRLFKDDFVRWHRIVHQRGWAGASWPVEFGGTGWTALQQHVWDEEASLAGAPIIQPFGVNMVAPVIMAYGNAAQQRHYLPRILSCEDWWCQGYSEPGAGSDLANLRTRAVRDGDHYVINGTKQFISGAGYNDLYVCMVRTGEHKSGGITCLVVERDTPGLSFGAPERKLGWNASPSAQVIWCDFPRRYHNTRPNREGRVPCRRETARIGAAAQAVGALPRKPDPGRCLCHRSGLGQPADKRALPRRTPPIMARTHRYRHE